MMGIPKPFETAAILSFLAGAVHALAPDHWLPASVLAWQRGWSARRVALFAFACFLAHVALGAAIYFPLEPIFGSLQSTPLVAFALVLVVSMMGVRYARFSRVREVLRAGPKSVWGIFAVLSLLGPCEAIIPIYIKAGNLGMGYLVPFGAFLAGTMMSGIVCILVARALWDRPLWLPRGLNWARGSGALVPIMAGLALGLSALLRVS